MRNNKVTTKLPKYNSLTLNSFAHIAPSVGTSTLLLFIFLVPQIVMLFATKSFSSLYIVFASVTASLLADFVHTINNKDQNFNWLISSIQGILIGFLLPETYNPIAIFFVAFCCIILTKYAFGGFAASWINAVAVTVAVAFFVFVPAMFLFSFYYLFYFVSSSVVFSLSVRPASASPLIRSVPLSPSLSDNAITLAVFTEEELGKDGNAFT